MTQQNLKLPYNRQNWQNWLNDIFAQQMEFEAQAEKVDVDKEHIKSVHRFATVKLADGKNLAVLDIETKAGVQIARNRVGLRNLVGKFIDHNRYHGILAFYHSENAGADVSPAGGGVPQGRGWETRAEYRLSFISSEPTIKEDGTFEIQATAPKRFSYVLGENEKTKTPADRLKSIADKRGTATLEDVKKAFSVETLTKEFYKELSDWYFWALQNVEFPNDLEQDKEVNNSTAVIRLITRLIFVWFLKQKKLINDELFDTQELDKILNYKDKTDSTYYKAILQNLFFATLNTEMGDKRKFVNRQSGIQGFYRYERFFKNKERFVELTKNTPFLNGGLFENLDKNIGEENEIRIDCFSNRIDKELLLKVPDFLFFGEEQQVDLNKIYDTKNKTYNVRGLIDILKTYHFTIEENTPTDIEVALDPELLGKVFENLLASFNPETQTTARKQTGSFYTPREIVDYMVEESLKAYLLSKPGFLQDSQDLQDYKTTIDNLFLDDNLDNLVNINKIVVKTIIEKLNDAKILDPACGSGAFPMGILQKMVQLLQKLDPQNKLWKQRQLDLAEKIEDVQAREVAMANIEEAFEENELDYGRKLFLIENCIFGVDIQPIAVQISKLRFFISLICEQTLKPEKPNFGIRPLPNLETKFVSANTLIGLDKPEQTNLFRTPEIIEKENDLKDVRHKHFSARTPETKAKYREKDQVLRYEIAEILTSLGYAEGTAQKLALWNPYDQNASSTFFDMEWMFGLSDGFDIVIGNPPYIGEKGNKHIFEPVKEGVLKEFYQGKMDYFYFFFHQGINLLKDSGILSFITTNYFITATGGSKLRQDFKTRTELLHLINFGELKIFESAMGQHNMITVLQKSTVDSQICNCCLVDRKGFAGGKTLQDIFNKKDEQSTYTTIPQNELYDGKELYIRLGNKGAGDTLTNILNKIANGNELLGNICEVNTGIMGGCDYITPKNILYADIEYVRNNDIQKDDGVFVLDSEHPRDLIILEQLKDTKPFYKNSDISKYVTNIETHKQIVFSSKTAGISSNVLNVHLNKFKKILEKIREINRENLNDWCFLRRGASNPHIFNNPKIVAPQRNRKNTFGYNETEWYASADVYFITEPKPKYELKYILALLNSKLYYVWLYNKGKRKGETLELYQQPLSEIPIKLATKKEQSEIVDVVDKIISTKQANPQADTTALEKQIGTLIYALYGLTQEEIEIIEQ
ncbi:MAG: Eco57I restriction-modification methylase domain-containing protein [Bacteroidales bacterium]|nr:Eco57I restriction-modification methylase domain-containing protein [Bacteroidales bacterium]